LVRFDHESPAVQWLLQKNQRLFLIQAAVFFCPGFRHSVCRIKVPGKHEGGSYSIPCIDSTIQKTKYTMMVFDCLAKGLIHRVADFLMIYLIERD